jgi:hypothetical protein
MEVCMAKMSLNQINLKAQKIHESIEDKQAELTVLQVNLETLQGQCPHPGVEEYRGRMVGECNTCFKKFLAKGQVDGIFAE